MVSHFLSVHPVSTLLRGNIHLLLEDPSPREPNQHAKVARIQPPNFVGPACPGNIVFFIKSIKFALI